MEKKLGTNDAILSVSDAATETADNPLQSPASPATTDAAMAVSVHSSPSGPSTLPSSLLPVGEDSPMGAGDVVLHHSESRGAS